MPRALARPDAATPVERPSRPARSRIAEFAHELPRTRVVDRMQFLRRITAGRRVIDLGFVDEGRMTVRRDQGAWLHEELSRTARELIGIDVDEGGVTLARELGFEAHVVDCQDPAALEQLDLRPADVVVAGELIEHLDRPGEFLEAVKCLVAPGGVLVLTTPNAARLTNSLASLAGRELVNPTHVAWYSWLTLKTLLARHGWLLDEFAFYVIPALPTSAAGAPRDRTKLKMVNAARALLRPLFAVRPALADGIVAVAIRMPTTEAHG
jgi:SAM-dependent methyltransferase